MAAHRLAGGIVLVALIVAADRPATAQPAAVPPAEAVLAGKLDPGDRVSIATLDGVTVKGRFVEVGNGVLRLRQDEVTRQIAIAEIRKVRRTRVGLLLGTAIGLGVGVGLGLAAASYAENEAGSGATAFLWVAGLSTAAGIGVDAALNLPRTVYDRDRTLTVAPLVTPRAAGVAMRIRF